MTDLDKLCLILKREEGEWPKGERTHPDPSGQTDTWAIGYGHQITDPTICALLAAGGTLICNRELAEVMLIAQAQEALESAKIHYPMATRARSVAIALAIYQIGPKFLTWPDTRTAIRAQDWKRAAAAMRSSEWHNNQTPARAERVCKMVESGDWPAWIREVEYR